MKDYFNKTDDLYNRILDKMYKNSLVFDDSIDENRKAHSFLKIRFLKSAKTHQFLQIRSIQSEKLICFLRSRTDPSEKY